jgi:hypothetical protein
MTESLVGRLRNERRFYDLKGLRARSVPKSSFEGENAMAAYLIADTDITDYQTYDEYKRQVAPVISKFGGRFLVRGGKQTVLEGPGSPIASSSLSFRTWKL